MWGEGVKEETSACVGKVATGRARGLRWAENVCAMWGVACVGDGGDGGGDWGVLLVGGGVSASMGSRVGGDVGKRRVRGRAGDLCSM